MINTALRSIKRGYNKVITSIAFLPAIIALIFLVVSILMIFFDFSEAGKNLKSNLHWLSLKDANTARSICSAIAGGIISLAVFSFSMVMILLGQAAAQMSNRILGKLISNRFQQIVLGFYIGTIVYALFLLSTIRDINTGIYVPAISTYFLIALTVVDIFLFIYFLHYITESVKFETIIQKIHTDTKNALEKSFIKTETKREVPEVVNGYDVKSHKSGLFQGFDAGKLAQFCKNHDIVIFFNYPLGSYIMENTSILTLSCKNRCSDTVIDNIRMFIDISSGQEIGKNFHYGFRQLMEIAIKALSPGINDPGTATISLQAIGDLLAYWMKFSPVNWFSDDEKTIRIVVKKTSFDDLFVDYIMPIWDYGKNDRLIQKELLHILMLLETTEKKPAISRMIQELHHLVAKDPTKSFS